MSREEQFGIVKGWLIAKEAPPAILDALASIGPEALRTEGALSAADHGWTPHGFEEGDVGQLVTPSGTVCFDLSPSQSVTAETPRKKREWSQEQRAAAAERMRTRQAAKRHPSKLGFDPLGERLAPVAS